MNLNLITQQERFRTCNSNVCSFNLLKKREGLETTRVRSQHNLLARCTFTTIVTLLLEMAGTRRKKKVQKYKQLALFVA